MVIHIANIPQEIITVNSPVFQLVGTCIVSTTTCVFQHTRLGEAAEVGKKGEQCTYLFTASLLHTQSAFSKKTTPFSQKSVRATWTLVVLRHRRPLTKTARGKMPDTRRHQGPENSFSPLLLLSGKDKPSAKSLVST